MLKRFSARKGELIEQIAGLFAEKLTLAEIRELTRFYRPVSAPSSSPCSRR